MARPGLVISSHGIFLWTFLFLIKLYLHTCSSPKKHLRFACMILSEFTSLRAIPANLLTRCLFFRCLSQTVGIEKSLHFTISQAFQQIRLLEWRLLICGIWWSTSPKSTANAKVPGTPLSITVDCIFWGAWISFPPGPKKPAEKTTFLSSLRAENPP